jgi:hypothetical protein
MALEEPEFGVIRRLDGVELRRYAPRVVAETLVTDKHPKAATAGFRRLANYLLGENRSGRGSNPAERDKPVTLLMGAPYVQIGRDEGQLLQFPLPRRYDIDSAPVPTDPKVTLRALKARRVAVIRYSGVWTEPRFRLNLTRLEIVLRAAGIAWEGGPEWARYDPPWKPWFARRNEIWLALAPEGQGGATAIPGPVATGD